MNLRKKLFIRKIFLYLLIEKIYGWTTLFNVLSWMKSKLEFGALSETALNKVVLFQIKNCQKNCNNVKLIKIKNTLSEIFYVFFKQTTLKWNPRLKGLALNRVLLYFRFALGQQLHCFIRFYVLTYTYMHKLQQTNTSAAGTTYGISYGK